MGEAEAAAFGLTVDEASGPPLEIWPDNVDAINTFISMSTQWRVGFSGATGLDYTALAAVMDLIGIAASSRAEVFDAVRIMEDAALETMRINNKAAKNV